MKKTICDLCGGPVSALGMFDGQKFLIDHWNHSPGEPDRPCTVNVDITVQVQSSVSRHKTPVDLCRQCLKGFLAALPNRISPASDKEETNAVSEVGSNSKA